MTDASRQSDVFRRPRAFARKLRREIDLSQAALWAETLAAGLWPAFAVICAAAALVALGALERLDAGEHWAAIGTMLTAIFAALIYGFRGISLPRRAAAIKRLDTERPDRPLAVMSDRMVEGAKQDTEFARALWREHQRRAEAAAADLSARAPDLRLAARDRWALRFVAPTALAGVLIGVGDAGPFRLAHVLEPGATTAADAGRAVAEPALDAWAVPPAYTGQETVYLNRHIGKAAPLKLPEGTEVTIRATGMETSPKVVAEPIEGATAFTSLGGGLHEVAGRLTGSGLLEVGPAEAPMASWTLVMVPDDDPEIGFTGRPGPGPGRALEVPYAASDDYGVVSAWAVISLAEPAEQRAEIPDIEFGLPLPISGGTGEVADRAVRDLTEHPWAGADVVITLYAEDGAGQIGTSEPVRFRLPERRFTDPMARALAEQRRELLLDYEGADRVLDVVQSVIRFPEAMFDGHAGAYVAVRLALRRLAPAIPDASVPDVAADVAEFFWRAALSLEEGDLSSALERLREAEQRLRSALESGTDEEIQAALDELREAMQAYLEEMMRQALENPEMLQQAPPADMSAQDLEEMLRQLEQQAQSGLRDQARQMLDQLAQMLENLQMGRSGQGQSPGEQAMQQLQEMIQRQQGLADETFDSLRQQRRQGQQGQRGQQPGREGEGQQPGQQGRAGQGEGGDRAGSHSENGRLSAEQEALRRAIEELANQLGGGEGMDGASRALDRAGEAMGRARDDLSEGEMGNAVQDQMDALDSLNGAAEALAESIEQGQGQQAARGSRPGEGDDSQRDPMDPFDRPAGSTDGAMNGRIRGGVPDQALIDRARELLEELRRRSSERDRPDLELRYFERLLEQF